jgi:hypothetical protein
MSRPWWPRMAGLQALSTRAFGPRLRRLTALTALATRPLIATKRPTARCGQSVCKCHAEKFRSAIFARILTAVHTRQYVDTTGAMADVGSWDIAGNSTKSTLMASALGYSAPERTRRVGGVLLDEGSSD